MIKLIKQDFCPNLGSGMNGWSKSCARILNDAYTSFSIVSKNYIFIESTKHKTKETQEKTYK